MLFPTSPPTQVSPPPPPPPPHRTLHCSAALLYTCLNHGITCRSTIPRLRDASTTKYVTVRYTANVFLAKSWALQSKIRRKPSEKSSNIMRAKVPSVGIKSYTLAALPVTPPTNDAKCCRTAASLLQPWLHPDHRYLCPDALRTPRTLTEHGTAEESSEQQRGSQHCPTRTSPFDAAQ